MASIVLDIDAVANEGQSRGETAELLLEPLGADYGQVGIPHQARFEREHGLADAREVGPLVHAVVDDLPAVELLEPRRERRPERQLHQAYRVGESHALEEISEDLHEAAEILLLQPPAVDVELARAEDQLAHSIGFLDQLPGGLVGGQEAGGREVGHAMAVASHLEGQLLGALKAEVPIDDGKDDHVEPLEWQRAHELRQGRLGGPRGRRLLHDQARRLVDRHGSRCGAGDGGLHLPAGEAETPAQRPVLVADPPEPGRADRLQLAPSIRQGGLRRSGHLLESRAVAFELRRLRRQRRHCRSRLALDLLDMGVAAADLGFESRDAVLQGTLTARISGHRFGCDVAQPG